MRDFAHLQPLSSGSHRSSEVDKTPTPGMRDFSHLKPFTPEQAENIRRLLNEGRLKRMAEEKRKYDRRPGRERRDTPLPPDFPEELLPD